MNKTYKRSLLPSLLAAVALVMAGIIYAEIRARPTVESETPSNPAATEGRTASHLPRRQTMPERTRFVTIVSRPLFSASRRPRSEEPPVVNAPTLDFSLSGIVTATGEPLALIKPDAGGDTVRVKQGQEVFGWTVSRIEADRIQVQHDGMESELLLDFAAPAPPPPEIPNAPLIDPKTGVPVGQQPAGEDGAQTGEPVSAPQAAEPEPAEEAPADYLISGARCSGTDCG
jgi:hypothetical protein